MSETITLNGVDRSSVIQRKNLELVEHAYNAEVGTGRVQIDDAAGSISVPGYKNATVEQSSSTPSRIFSGFTHRKGIRRGETYTTGAGREYDVTLLDGNDLLRRIKLRGAEAKRPNETVSERVDWLLSTGWVLAADYGRVQPSDVGLDKSDCRGQYPGDVLAECQKAARFNCYVRWNEDEDDWELVFRDDNQTSDDTWLALTDTCTLSISNDMTEVDEDTVFAPFEEAELSEDPEDVYSHVYGSYAKGYITEERAATATAFTERWGTTEDSGIKNESTARRDAQTFLYESKDEEQVLPVTIELDKTRVGLVQAGQRIAVHMTHMDPEGWGNALDDSPIYARIARLRKTQPKNTDETYHLSMDLMPQEAGPSVGQIIQSDFAFWGTGGSGFSPYSHLPNPPTIGNQLLVAISKRAAHPGDVSIEPPNTDSDRPRWGAGAWTEIPLDIGGFTDTYVENTASDGTKHAITFFWKDVDDTSQTCAILNDYQNVGVWETSGVDYSTATLVRANNQSAATTFDVGTLGTVSSGELAFMIVHSSPDEPGTSAQYMTPAAGWVKDWERGSYPIWYTWATFPVVWMGHAIGDGSTVDPSLTHAWTARRWCGLAIKVGP